MRSIICFLIVCLFTLFTIGCAMENTASTPIISQEKAVAGAEYLNASAAKMLAAINKAKEEDPSVTVKANNAASVIQNVVVATDAFKANATQNKWDIAKSALDAAIQVVMPIAVNALLK